MAVEVGGTEEMKEVGVAGEAWRSVRREMSRTVPLDQAFRRR
jgi:hypothetical protein